MESNRYLFQATFLSASTLFRLQQDEKLCVSFSKRFSSTDKQRSPAQVHLWLPGIKRLKSENSYACRVTELRYFLCQCASRLQCRRILRRLMTKRFIFLFRCKNFHSANVGSNLKIQYI
jgi:hypothetical protein